MANSAKTSDRVPIQPPEKHSFLSLQRERVNVVGPCVAEQQRVVIAIKAKPAPTPPSESQTGKLGDTLRRAAGH